MSARTFLETFGAFVFFTGLVGLGTWWLTRRDRHDTSSGYFLGGRSLTAGYIAGSLLLTNLSTEQLVGLNGAAFSDGLSVMAWEVVAGASLVVMALFFLPRYLKSGIATVPQFLAERFAPSTRTITTIIFIVAYAVILLPLVLFTGATGLRDILNLPALTGIQSETALLWLTVWLIGIVGSIYAIFGGLRTVAVSDTLNGFGLLVGGLLIIYLGLKAVNPEGVFAALGDLKRADPEKFNSLGRLDQQVPWPTLFTGVLLLNLFYWCTNQQIIQRAFAAPTLAEGQKGVLLAGVFKVFAPLILVLPGIIAYHLYANEISEPNFAYGTLVKKVLPPSLAGFFAAVMFGAILSSFNSALNSTATLFSLGVYRDIIRPSASEKEVIASGKLFGVAIAVASMTIAPFLAGQKSIFAYLQTMNAIYFIPIFSVVLVGMLSKRVPALAANTALIGGVLVMLAVYFVPPLHASVLGPPKGTYENLHTFHFLGAMFLALCALMLIIGAIKPRATPWEHHATGEVDLTPWRWAKPAGIALVLFVAAIYAYFADPSAIRTAPVAEAANEEVTQM
ncbi:MAG: solute:sodium symporter family transporter [Planctomycetota bacterium]|nr:solute:sodium symporter family transporter [Planctomycetaceae bacterium]MDQ3330240.1 solute:sodium symporter family transporter [Planctomycetota bacterium]